MKELSVEEKAKRYDEAVINGSRLWECGKITRENYEYMFPELKESEDERILRRIINIVDEYSAKHQIDNTDCVDWLEKQGGQRLAWSEEDKNMLKWIIGYLENKMLNAPISEERTACKNAIAWLLEKQGEQKPAEDTEAKLDKNRLKLDPNPYWTMAPEYQLIKNQNPAWDEGDEAMVNSIISFCDFKVNAEKDNEGVVDASRNILFWLNKLQYRVQPQPKQEWSEEDEEKLNWFEKFFRAESVVAEGKDIPQDRYLWFKNLKERVQPQNTWKPSDLPHWQKSNLPNDTTTGFNSDYFCHKGYCINYKELFDKLPKDD